jgi:hypothetical protein
MEDLDAISEFFTFGFVLGKKTLIRDHKIPEININYRIEETITSWKDVYQALENSVIESIQSAKSPCMLLSGGMDSRIIAGIIADNKLDVPFYTLGILPKETRVSKTISKVLDGSHTIIPIKEDQDLLEYQYLRDIASHTLGTLSMPYFIWRSSSLRTITDKEKNSTFITGLYGTELLSETITHQSNSIKDFCERLYQSRYRIQTLEMEFHIKALSNLLRQCKGLTKRSLYYEAYIKPRARTETQTIDGNPVISPFLNTDVLTSIFSLPPDLRREKRINHQIIKHKFPTLAQIPDVTPPKRNKNFTYLQNKFFHAHAKKNFINFDALFRNKPDLKKYIKHGIPSISNKAICEKIVDCFYHKKMNISKPLSYFLTYYHLKDES